MIAKKWENLLRKIPGIQRHYFNRINQQLGLSLDYKLNQDAQLIFEHIFLHREYAAWFPFYQKATILDIGAHYGFFALFAAMNTAPGSQIYAFEPSPRNFLIFEQNIKQHQFPQIKGRQIAIAGKSGMAPLYGGASFNHSLIGQGGTVAETPTLSLVDLISELALDQVDFLKLDCEGAEYEIILSCPIDTLAKCQVISLEFHDLRQLGYAPQQLVQRLEEANFTIEQYSFSTDHSGTNLNFGRLIARRKP